MPTPRQQGCLLRSALLALAVAWPLTPAADEAAVPDAAVPKVDWHYASVFGTGRYRAGERTVTALLLPFAWRPGQPDGRPWSWRLLAPVTLGAIDFGLGDVIDRPLDSVSMLTFTPGVEFTVPVGSAWTLRPFATLGGGLEFDGGDRAWIYSAGVSAQRRLACRRVRCTLGLAMTWAGFNANRTGRDDMSHLSAGLDFVFSDGARAFNRQLDPGLYLVYRNYLADLGFVFDPLGVKPLHQEWEVGFSLNASRPFSVLGYRLDRLGLSYRRSGDLRGVHLTSRFPF